MIKYIIEDMKKYDVIEFVVCSGSSNKLAILNKYKLGYLDLQGEITLVCSDGKCITIQGEEIEDYEVIERQIYLYVD